jgi:hypothetical protein
MPMVSTRNPDTMTEPERRSEITSLLARALVRRVRQVRAESSASKEALDLSSETRLSVAKRPAG